MKRLTQTLSLILFLTLGASNAWALPACPSSGYFHNCFGTLTQATGTYVGDYQHNMPHGKGTWTSTDYSNDEGIVRGQRYVGEWELGKRSGWGTLLFNYGDKYVGEFKVDQLNGQGTYFWSNGPTYKGEFKDNRINGQGTRKRGLGKTEIGTFKNNELNGHAIIYNSDGSIYQEGIFKEDKFLYTQKKRKVDKPNFLLLKAAFIKLSKQHRLQIQKNLKGLDFYKASIDGLFGASTLAAFTAYNKQNLNGAALSKPENVVKLITAVLSLKSNPKIALTPTPTPNPNTTSKVASGTGFYISEKGHIITNHHVIDGCKNMKVHSKGKAIVALKIADDKRNDLALLKISERPSHVFALSDKSPYPLQSIIAAGFPFGNKLSSTLKFTEGIVSSVAGLGNDYSQIQIDAALNIGNSGGPILDEYGNIVAVAVAKLSLKKILKDYGVIPENINFGVKASAVRNLMEGNAVPFKSPNSVVISRQELSKNVTAGTVYLTCWMTTAQIEQMRSKKVLFEDLN
jgi:S1-C subfamily serine protease